jgi:CRISPR-associated protein (TIGR02710 family)
MNTESGRNLADIKKILFVTVGGSCEPIIKSIEHHQPNFVYFICSTGTSGKAPGSISMVMGEGQGCKTGNSIPEITGIAENQYEVIAIAPGEEDDPGEAYKKIREKICQVLSQWPSAQVIADYTGGTKSMSVALFSAAIDFEKVNISMVTGMRDDLTKVKNFTENAVTLNKFSFVLERQLGQANGLIAKFSYASAGKLIEDLLSAGQHFSVQNRLNLQKLHGFCLLFDAWDKFDHARAFVLFSGYEKYFSNHLVNLKKTITERKLLDEGFSAPEKFVDLNKGRFHLVNDLMLNAHRRGIQKRFDDGVGRIYRALELFAQTFLLTEYGIKTGNVPVDELPEKARKRYDTKKDENGTVKLGLMESYELICLLGEEENGVGKIFEKYRNKILSEITSRNNSLLAHGFTPVSERSFNSFFELTGNFFSECFIATGLSEKETGIQLPQAFPEL